MTDALSWQYFRDSSFTPEDTFEGIVAKRLFCSTIRANPEELICPNGFPGIECHPVETSSGWASFQAKYSYDGKQNVAEFECLKHAYARKATGAYQLDVIYCYSAGTAPRKVTQKQKEIEALATQHGVQLIWRFADQILEQLRDSTDPLVLLAKREFFEDLPQPTLLIPSASENPEGACRYHFSQQATPLIGREDEISTLREFLFKDESFSWWGVLGKAGSGKSRLLLDIGHTLSDDWQWGWLTDFTLTNFDFSNWQPNKHTLFIVDYVVGREQEIGDFLDVLFCLEQKDLLQHCVRLVLIEREIGQWFKNLKNLKIIRSWVEEKLHSANLLVLDQLNDNALLKLAEVLIRRHENCQIGPAEFVERALDIGPERAPLIMQLLITSGEAESVGITDLVREFIERDRQTRWSPAEVDDDDLAMLTVTTMCGGIDLNNARWNLPETHDYFALFQNFERHSIMTGSTAKTGQLEGLEPDLFGELFVLDRLQVLRSRNPLSNEHKQLLKLAMTIDEGRTVVSFFSKCRADYPSHPIYSIFVSPPEGAVNTSVWTLPTKNPSDLVWLLITANLIDVPAIEESCKLTIYRSVVNCTISNGLFIDLIEQVPFIRLLSLFAVKSKCKQYLGELEIADQSVFPDGQISTDFLEQLYSENYCNDVISDFRSIEIHLKLTLLGPHILTVYHHKLMHLLSDYNTDLQYSLSFFQEVLELLNEKYPENYVATVIAFHYLCRNIIAAFIQFGHSDRNAGLCIKTAKDIKEAIYHLSNIEINGKATVSFASAQENVIVAITSLFSLTREEYKYRLGLVAELGKRLHAPSGDISSSALNYVRGCVSLSHGFSSQEDYDIFYPIYQKCIEFSESFPSKDMALVMGMIHIQLYRNNTDYYINEDRQEFLSAAIELAKKFPDDEVDLFRQVITELSIAYKNAMKKFEMTIANDYLTTALSLIEQSGDIEYDFRKKIWCSALVTAGFDVHIERSYPLDSTEQALRVLHSSPVIAFEQCFNQIPGELFSRAQRAANHTEIEIFGRCKNCLRTLLPYFSFIPSYLEALPSI